MSRLGVLAQIGYEFAPNHFYITVENFEGWILKRKLFIFCQTPLEKYYFSLSKWPIVTDFWKFKNQDPNCVSYKDDLMEI